MGGRTYLNSYSAALDLTVGHLQPELIDTTFDSVPTCQSRCEMNIAGHSKICRVNDFIGGGVREYGFGMYASLVCKCAEAGDIVVEGNVDLDCTGNEVLNSLQLREVVLALHVVAIGHEHACNEASKWSNAVPLANAKDRCVYVGSSGLKRAIRIGYSTASVIVEMRFNITVYDAAKSPDLF